MTSLSRVVTSYVVPSGSLVPNKESLYYSRDIGMEIKYEHIINATECIESLPTILSSDRTNYLTIHLSQLPDEIFCSSIETIVQMLRSYKVVIAQLELCSCRGEKQYNSLLYLFDSIRNVPCRSIVASNQVLKKSPELFTVLFKSLIDKFCDINIACNRLSHTETLTAINRITNRNPPHIISLTLDNNTINYHAACSLYDWIQRGDAALLQYLSLCDCNLELNMASRACATTPIVVIADALSMYPHAIREVNLSNNIRNNKELPTVVFQLLSRQNTIQILHFNENKLSNSDMEGVARFIECSKIQHLSLSHCYLNDDDITSLIHSFNGSRSLRGLDISDNQLTEVAIIAQELIRPTEYGQGLEYINMSGSRPTLESFTQFSAWLTHASRLNTLILDNCSIDCNMISVLCSRVMIHWQQQEAVTSYAYKLSPPLHTVSAQRNLIGHRGAQQIAKLMSKCPNHPLRVLNISSNHIGSLGKSKLFSCLQADKQLVYLDLSKCTSDEHVPFESLEDTRFKLVAPPSHIVECVYLCLRRKIGSTDLIRCIISFLLIEIQRKIVV